MKYRIRETNEIVDVVCYSGCSYVKTEQDYVCYYDSKGNKVIGKGLNLIWDFESINETQNFNWQSFRNQATKDILTGIVAHSGVSISSTDAHRLTELALTYADELIRQLKENEKKDYKTTTKSGA